MNIDLNKFKVNKISETSKTSIFHTAFMLMIALVFVVGAITYFQKPEPFLDLVAPSTKSFPLRLEYLEKPIKIGFEIKTFLGNYRKVTLYFEFFDKEGKLHSRLTYVLSGGGDYMNYVNTTVSGVSYITIIKDYHKTGYSIILKNIVDDLNDGLRKINAGSLALSDIKFATINLQAWYDNSNNEIGDVSVDVYSLENFLIEK